MLALTLKEIGFITVEVFKVMPFSIGALMKLIVSKRQRENPYSQNK
jgi:hypothetical protein